MSGYTRDAMLHSGELPPGLQFIEKPLNAETLMRRMREMFEVTTSPPRTRG